MAQAAQAIAVFAKGRSRLRDELLGPAFAPVAPGPSATAARLARLVDAYFRQRLREVRPVATRDGGGGFALVAVGGYGRGEQSLLADIDVLLLYAGDVPESARELAGALFRPLWDLGLEVGHGVRRTDHCLELAGADMPVLASLLDRRLVAGEPSVLRELDAGLSAAFLAQRLPAFTRWLEGEMASRLERHGAALALLQPHLKLGLGGLREAHAARWLDGLLRGAGHAEAALDDATLRRLDAEAGLLLEVRSRLHAMTGKRQDVLALDLLDEAAAHCGMSGETGPDRLLAALHRAMEHLRAASQSLFRAARHVIGPREDAAAELDLPPGPVTPRQLLSLLLEAARGGMPLSLRMRRRLEEAAAGLDCRGGEADLAGPAFFEALFATGRAADVLEVLLETRLLGALLPPFAVSQDRIPHGGWHIHPVGRHSIETVRILEESRQEGSHAPAMVRACWDAAGPGALETLCWAALLHDVGKTPAEGSQGHEPRGARIASRLLTRWGLSGDLAREVFFLINEHLRLPAAAHGEDLSDAAVIQGLASVIQSPRRLWLLLLLTYADSKATGPRVWNDWSASLLFDLARRVEQLFRRRDAPAAEDVSSLFARREEVLALAAQRGLEEAAHFLEAMDTRYLLAVEPLEAVEHLVLRREFLKALEEARTRTTGGGERHLARVALLRARPALGGAWEALVAGRREARLLSVASGVLSLHGLDIMQADVFSFADGFVLHRFHVSPPPDPIYVEEFWNRVQSTLTYALSGKVSLEERLAEKRNSVFAAGNGAEGGMLVEALPEGGGLRVLVEADDRIGLLHDIVNALEAAGGRIRMARIQTRGHRAHDVFLVEPAWRAGAEDEHGAEAGEALVPEIFVTKTRASLPRAGNGR